MIYKVVVDYIPNVPMGTLICNMCNNEHIYKEGCLGLLVPLNMRTSAAKALYEYAKKNNFLRKY